MKTLQTMAESELRALLGGVLIERDGMLDIIAISDTARSAIENEIARRDAARTMAARFNDKGVRS